MPAQQPISKEIIERAKLEAEYINNEKDAYLRNEDKASSEANTTARTLSGQLLLVSGAILTFSSVMIGSQSTTSTLTYGWRVVLILSWILLAISAFAGVLQVWIDYKFFGRWKKYNHSIAEELVTGKYISTNIQEAKDKFKKPDEASKSLAMFVQGACLMVGIMVFLFVVGHLLLSLTNSQSQEEPSGRVHIRTMHREALPMSSP